MLEVAHSTIINTDASEVDLRPGEYRDALNISLIANAMGGFTKGTTYGNIDSNVRFDDLHPDAICLGTAIDIAGRRAMSIFFQKIPIPYATEYTAVINYAISRGYALPSLPVQMAQNYLIYLLKNAGIWGGLDVFYCFQGDGDENFAKINWKTPSDATLCVNHGLTYTLNEGFQGNGTSSYMDTQWKPSTATKYTLNNAGILEGMNTVSLSATGRDGAYDSTNQAGILHYTAVNTIQGAVNSNSTVVFVSTQFTDNSGIYFISRPDNATVHMRKNTSTVISVASLSSIRPTVNYYLGAFNNNGGAGSFNSNQYACWGAGENLETFDRQTKFWTYWDLYQSSFVTPLDTEVYVREVLMYLVTLISASSITPLVKSSLILAGPESYLDGYSFVNELFYFNFRDAAPKVINIQRAIESPGFYNNLSESSLTIIKPHPPFPPVVSRALGTVANASIQKKPFQFMMIYHFLDGEQSVKSPASSYLNSLDDRLTLTSLYDHINVQITFPQDDYAMVESIELFERNSNNIGEWRGVTIIDRTLFGQAGTNYQYTYPFYDNLVGNFYPLELATKINDSIPQNTNYLAFIENRIFVVDTIIDYDLVSTWQILLTLDTNVITGTEGIDDRMINPADPLYTQGTFMWDSEYTVGVAFYDKYGRKYPASLNDRKLTTPKFIPAKLPLQAEADALPNNYDPANANFNTYLRQPRITAKYDMRSAGNAATYGKPPQFAHWWGLIRTKNTKWEFQFQVNCLLRFPYSITKWTGLSTDIPANTFIEDDYLYWDVNKLLTANITAATVDNLVNDYIDVVVPPNFPYPLDSNIFIDFAYEVTTQISNSNVTLLDREVIEIFSNKIRIRGDRDARWFRKSAPLGVFRKFPKYVTGVDLTGAAGTIGGQDASVLFRDETKFLLILKRRRQSDLQSIILYDEPFVYPVYNPGTKFAAFQNQGVTVARIEYTPISQAPQLSRTLNQGDVLIQPVHVQPTSVADNHSIKILWGPNGADATRLMIKVSVYELNDQKQPVKELFSSTEDANGKYRVGNNELIEYSIGDVELTTGWYGYGIQVIPYNESGFQFENPEFDIASLFGWLQSTNVPALWAAASPAEGNVAFINVSDLASGFSRSLYQNLYGAEKGDITIDVVIDSVGILGPATGGAIVLNSGNVFDTTEAFTNARRYIVPYSVDCHTIPRSVTLNSLKFQLTNAVPAGSQARAETWSLDQVTNKPIALLSAGIFVSLGAIGQYTLPFAAGPQVINTTGLYGMAIYFEGPTVTDFANKDFSQGEAGWTDLKNADVQWTFSPYTPPNQETYQRDFVPVGGVSTYGKIGSTIISQPVYFPASTDPAGFYNHSIIINWGDNAATGWNGRAVDGYLYVVNQTFGAHLPTNQLVKVFPIYVGSLVNDAVYLLDGTFRLAGNQYYGFALGIPLEYGPQFNNWDFSQGYDLPNYTPKGWSQTRQSGNQTWTNTGGGYASIGAQSVPVTQETTYIGQAVTIGAGYKVSLDIITMNVQQTGDYYYARLYGSWNGGANFDLIEQSGVIMTTSPPYGNTGINNPTFSPFRNAKYEYLWVTFVGTTTTGMLQDNIYLSSITNLFSAQIDDLGPSVEVRPLSDPDYNAYFSYGNGVQIIDNYGFEREKAGWSTNKSPRTTYGNQWTYDTAPYGLPSVNCTIDPTDTGETYSSALYQKKFIPAGTHRVKLQWVGGSADNSNFYVVAFNDPNNVLGSGNIVCNFPTTNGLREYFDGNISFAADFNYIGILLYNPATPVNGRVYVELVQIYLVSPFSLLGGTYPVRAWGARETDTSFTAEFPANYYISNLPSGQASSAWGQLYKIGTKITVDTFIFAGDASNNYDIVLKDANDVTLGSTSVNGQPLNSEWTIEITAVNPASTDGLFIRISSRATNPISVRVRKMTNLSNPPLIQADSTPYSATWVYDENNNSTQLSTGTVTTVDATEDVPQPPANVIVVMGDGSGNEISAQQSFLPNSGKVTLRFNPTLSIEGVFDYGVMVKNAPGNNQIAGSIRIHSITNVLSNNSVVEIIANTVNGGSPQYEAWGAVSPTFLFARAGYVSNFVAVTDDLTYSAFTPVQMTPDSYHLVTNMLENGIEGHSNDTPVDTYKFGIPFPEASSDPDASGNVYLTKVGQSIGDINIKVTDLKKRSNSNVIRWSDPIIVGTKRNSLNAFLDGNKYAVDFQRGAIEVMLPMHDHTLFCVHRNGMSSVYVNRAIMISPSEVNNQDNAALYLTSNVIQNDNKLTSNLGTINPESCRVVESGTIAYGFDLTRKSLWQKSNNGVRNLTYEGNAKTLFNAICYYRILAVADGEDVKVYSAYNEKEKIFYLTFAPFTYRGQIRQGITIGWSAYLNGFISRYSFEPISYMATEDVLYSIKSSELTNPDFFGRFTFWETKNTSGGTAPWYQYSALEGQAGADTVVPTGTRINNPDFSAGSAYWSQYGAGASFSFSDDGAVVTLPATTGASKDLVNASGAPGTYSIRLKTDLPVTGVSVTIKVYNPSGVAIQTLHALAPITGDDFITVTQTLAGRIGLIFSNTGAQIIVKVRLFTTAVKTYLLYQALALEPESVRVRFGVPARTGRMKALIYSFDDPAAPLQNLLATIDLVLNKDLYLYEANIPNPNRSKYVGLYTITDYDLTLIDYFNVNSVPILWVHGQFGLTNNFFNVQYDSAIAVVFNVQAGQVRIFNSLAIKSTDVWSVESILTSDNNVSALSEENFRLRDGVYYASILRDITTPQDALPDPVNNKPILHGRRMTGVWIRLTLRNAQTLRRVELRAVYLGSDELAGHYLNKK